jgi:hypothetical protein
MDEPQVLAGNEQGNPPVRLLPEHGSLIGPLRRKVKSNESTEVSELSATYALHPLLSWLK